MSDKGNVAIREIFLSFTRIGAVLFGGGYAMLPLIDREVVTKRGWAKSDDMADFYALGQLIPGVVAINTAMLIGFKLRGFKGAFAAMMGTILVPFIVILAYAIAFDALKECVLLSFIMNNIRPAVAGMMLGMGWIMFRRTSKTPITIAITLISAVLLFFKVSALLLILSGIVIGLVWYAFYWKQNIDKAKDSQA